MNFTSTREKISCLSPEAREDANKIASQIWELGRRVITGENGVACLTETETTWDALVIRGPNSLKDTIYENTDYDREGVDLAIAWLRNPRLKTEPMRHPRSEWYFFYPGHTIKEVRSLDDSGNEIISSKEADKDDLAQLLDIMRKRFGGIREIRISF